MKQVMGTAMVLAVLTVAVGTAWADCVTATVGVGGEPGASANQSGQVFEHIDAIYDRQGSLIGGDIDGASMDSLYWRPYNKDYLYVSPKVESPSPTQRTAMSFHYHSCVTCMDPSGDYVYEANGAKLYRFSTTNGAMDSFSLAYSGTHACATDGRYIYVPSSEISSTVYKYTMTGTHVSTTRLKQQVEIFTMSVCRDTFWGSPSIGNHFFYAYPTSQFNGDSINYVTSWDVGSGTPYLGNLAYDGTYFYLAWMGDSSNTFKRFYSDRTLWTTGTAYVNSRSCMAMSAPPLPGDVGTTRIMAPSGDIPYGVPVIPQAEVRNYSSVAQRFSVRFDIDTVYSSIRYVDNLLPDDSVTVSFDTFPATTPGSHAVKCSTQLSTDTVPTNDKATDACFVSLVDAGTGTILAPTGAIPYGTPVTPQARVRNFGTAAATFTAKFTIGTFYRDSQTVSNLPAGESLIVSFADWAADTAGTFATRCSTELTGDMRTGNDRELDSVLVRVDDVGATAIKAPRGTMFEGTVVTPACSLYNYGNVTEGPYDVRMTFASYDQTVSVSSHAAGRYIYLTFPNWTATVGTHATACSTRLGTDMTPGNDKATGSVTVVPVEFDVGVSHLLAPLGTFDSGATAVPACSVYDYGDTTPGTYNVRLKIGSYNRTAAVTGPAPRGRVYVTFPTWTATVCGVSVVTCSTELARDIQTANDKATDSVTVVPLDFDVGVSHLLAPSGAVDSGASIVPACSLYNYGDTTPGIYTVRMKIGIYNRGVTISGPAPGGRIYVTFPGWTARVRGANAVGCSTELSGDLGPGNNKATGSVVVNVNDVGSVAIVAPVGTILPGAVTPQATMRNYGTTRKSCTAIFTISDLLPYLSTITLSDGLPFADTVLSFESWTAHEGSYTARCRTYLGGDQVPANDIASTDFTVIALVAGWARQGDLPLGPKSKNVRDGGALAYGKPGTDANDTGYIYAFKGNNTYEFYRYNTLAGAWVPQESIPAIGSSSKKKAVKKGSSLVYATNGKVYATKGNGTLEWWMYDPAVGHWVERSRVPAGAKACKEGTSTAAVNVGGTDYVYFLKGSATTEFYRYNADTDAWDTSLPPAPTGTSGKPYKNGSALTCDGTDLVYCLKGSYNEFAAYSISGRAWTTRNPLPLIGPSGKKKKVKDGAGLAAASGAIYALKGGGTNEFWQFKIGEGKWYAAPDVPAGSKTVKGGGALVAARDVSAMYAYRGNNTREFWQYGPVSIGGVMFAPGGDQKEIQEGAVVRNVEFGLRIAPNPFNRLTAIRYSLAKPGDVSLKLYDVTGKLTRILASGYRAAGEYSSQLTAYGSQLSAGVYLLKYEAGDYRATEKLIIE